MTPEWGQLQRPCSSVVELHSRVASLSLSLSLSLSQKKKKENYRLLPLVPTHPSGAVSPLLDCVVPRGIHPYSPELDVVVRVWYTGRRTPARHLMTISNLSVVQHWRASLDLIRSLELTPTIGEPGTKAFGKWGPTPLDQVSLGNAETHNIGFQNTPKLLDVDIDSDSPSLRAALDLLLPHTHLVYGRPSRPRSHRLYATNPVFDRAAFPTLTRVTNLSKVEIRGTETRHSILPGSLHESGERYEWESPDEVNSATPSTVDPVHLFNAVRRATAASLLADAWLEGSRNHIVMALAGALYTLAAGDSVNQPISTKEDAKAFITVILDIAYDDEYDSRMVAFESTWRKAEAGESTITGLTRLSELTGNPDLRHLLPELLSDDPVFGEMQDMYENVFMMADTGRVLDIRQLGVPGRAGDELAVTNFKLVYANKKVRRADGKVVTKADVWLGSPQRLTIDRREFNPEHPPLAYSKDGAWWLNYWSGFAIPPLDTPVEDAEVEPLVQYLWDIIANQKKRRYEWVVAWLGQMLARPAHKPGTALVLVGGQRIGKSFLGAEIIRPIIGPWHSVTTSEGDRVTHNFNKLLSHKLFAQLDEAVRSSQRAKASVLKSYITDQHQIMEAKGIDAIQIESHTRFMFTTNDTSNAIFLDPDDSRYTVIEVSSARKQDTEYFGALSRWLKDNYSAVHRWLVDKYRASDVNLRIPLHTHEKNVLRDMSMSEFNQWLHYVADTGKAVHTLAEMDEHERCRRVKFADAASYHQMLEAWPVAMALNAIVAEVNNYLRYIGARDRMSMIQVKTEVEKSGIFGRRQNYRNKPLTVPVKMYGFPTLEAIEEYMEKRT